GARARAAPAPPRAGPQPRRFPGKSALHETGRAGRSPVARVVVDGVVAKREDGAAVDRAESNVVRRHHRRADEDLRAGSAGPDARTAIEIGRRALDIQIDRRTTDGDDAEAAVGAHQGVLDVGEDDAATRARRAKALEIPLQLDPLQGDEGAARTGIDEDAAAAGGTVTVERDDAVADEELGGTARNEFDARIIKLLDGASFDRQGSALGESDPAKSGSKALDGEPAQDHVNAGTAHDDGIGA